MMHGQKNIKSREFYLLNLEEDQLGHRRVDK